MRLQSLNFEKSSTNTTHRQTLEIFFKNTRIRSQMEEKYKQEKIQEVRKILGDSAIEEIRDKTNEGRKFQNLGNKEARNSL